MRKPRSYVIKDADVAVEPNMNWFCLIPISGKFPSSRFPTNQIILDFKEARRLERSLNQWADWMENHEG